MDRKFFLIAMAAGQGTRLGGPLPKQFLDLGGAPILQRTLERFLEAEPGLHVVTVLPAEHIERWKELCFRHSFECPQTLVAGGITRFHSVRNALRHVPDGAVAAIHDGVRPLVSPDLIRRMLERMDECPALIPVIPSVDTLHLLQREEDGSLTALGDTPAPRERIWRAQTPQMFHSECIKAAYEAPYDPSFTDDASVARKKKTPLSYIEGERYNLKITTEEDLAFVRTLWPISRSGGWR